MAPTLLEPICMKKTTFVLMTVFVFMAVSAVLSVPGAVSAGTIRQSHPETLQKAAKFSAPAVEPVTEPATNGKMRPPVFNVWRSIGAMVVVLGALLAMHSFIRKRMGTSAHGGGERRIKILEKLPIDNRRSFMLLKVNAREILVGVGPERIDFLNVFGEGTEKNDPET